MKKKGILFKAIKDYDDKALVAVNNGQTHPDMAHKILWHHSEDWNTDFNHASTGNNYYQIQEQGEESPTQDASFDEQ